MVNREGSELASLSMNFHTMPTEEASTDCISHSTQRVFSDTMDRTYHTWPTSCFYPASFGSGGIFPQLSDYFPFPCLLNGESTTYGPAVSRTGNRQPRTEYTLYSSALSVNQRNAKLFNNMGRVLESLDKYEESLNYYNEAIRIQSDDVRGYLNLGRVFTHLRRYDEAENTYLKAKSLFLDPEETREREVRVTPNHLQLFLNLAFLISRNDSRLEEADALYREAITLRSDFTNAYLNRGDVLLKMNRLMEESRQHNISARNTTRVYFWVMENFLRGRLLSLGCQWGILRRLFGETKLIDGVILKHQQS
ncbi:protein O-mannosyl-transferase Tmtc3 [Trichonephila clavipes]|nr:protein O-mannosyl-transferase Tmtc3 [Trichonephila clavipes]